MSPSLDQHVCDKDAGPTCLKTVGAQNIPPTHYSPCSSGIKTVSQRVAVVWLGKNVGPGCKYLQRKTCFI